MWALTSIDGIDSLRAEFKASKNRKSRHKRNMNPSLNACQVSYFLMDVPIFHMFLI
jgi:hypothetical protein